MPLCCSCSDCPSKPCSERLPTNFCGCAASLQIEPMMDSMSAAVISSLLIFRTMSSAPQPACRMPKQRNSSDHRDDRDSGDLFASLNRHPGQRWSPRGFFAFLPWLVLHSVPMSTSSGLGRARDFCTLQCARLHNRLVEPVMWMCGTMSVCGGRSGQRCCAGSVLRALIGV